MALHLNLYHEAHKQAALKRRDPLKFAITGLSAVAFCMAGYYLLQLNSQRTLSNELARVKSECDALTPKAEAAKKREEEIAATRKVSDLLVKRMEGRFYWAPVLGHLAQIVPREVQLTKLAGEVTGETVKRCALTIDGMAAGEDARKVAEDLRRAIAEQFSTKYGSVTSTFRSLEDSPETAMLNGRKVPMANFAINVVMQAGEDEAAPTARRNARKALP